MPSTSSARQDAPAALLDYAQTADYLGTTLRHVRRLVAERRLTHVKVGRLVRFRVSDLESFVTENTREAVR